MPMSTNTQAKGFRSGGGANCEKGESPKILEKLGFQHLSVNIWITASISGHLPAKARVTLIIPVTTVTTGGGGLYADMRKRKGVVTHAGPQVTQCRFLLLLGGKPRTWHSWLTASRPSVLFKIGSCQVAPASLAIYTGWTSPFSELSKSRGHPDGSS